MQVVKQPKARAIAAATWDSIISMANIADAVIGAAATHSTCTQQFATTAKCHGKQTQGFILYIDQMLLIISTKRKRQCMLGELSGEWDADRYLSEHSCPGERAGHA
jgi:hypothetical protein